MAVGSAGLSVARTLALDVGINTGLGILEEDIHTLRTPTRTAEMWQSGGWRQHPTDASIMHAPGALPSSGSHGDYTHFIVTGARYNAAYTAATRATIPIFGDPARLRGSFSVLWRSVDGSHMRVRGSTWMWDLRSKTFIAGFKKALRAPFSIAYGRHGRLRDPNTGSYWA